VSTARGRQGEERAARYLARRGYTILARNVRAANGELDIVARQGEILAFVEVKNHRRREASLLAMSPDKCRRLQAAASAWLAVRPELAGLQCRFDLIILSAPPGLGSLGMARIEHMPDIFR
jgi:putative endonuclease